MKKYSVAFLLCLISTIANAQIGSPFKSMPKDVLCGPVEIIFKTLLEDEVNEKPIWLGKNEDGKSNYAVFVNPKTSAFTIVQFGKEWGCIVGMGRKSQQLGNITKNL